MRRSAFTTTTTTTNVNIVIDEKERELSSFFSTVSLFHLYLLNQISNRMFSTLPLAKRASLSFRSRLKTREMEAYATSSSRFRPIDIVFQASKSPRRRPLFPFPSLPRDFIAFRQIFVVERLISLFMYLSWIDFRFITPPYLSLVSTFSEYRVFDSFSRPSNVKQKIVAEECARRVTPARLIVYY